jgi:hypothetical protein
MLKSMLMFAMYRTIICQKHHQKWWFW